MSSEEDLFEALRKVGRVSRVAAGEILFAKGDPADGAYVLISGSCHIVDADDQVYEIEPGRIFGEFAGLGGGKRTATVTAAEDSEVLLIVPEKLRKSEAALELVWGWLQDVATRGRNIRKRQEGLIDARGVRRVVQRTRLPSIAVIRKVAVSLLPDGLEGYIDGGAGDELTVKDNEIAWQDLQLLPHVLTGVDKRDTSVEVLGRKHPHPLLVAPTGFQRLMHPDAEIACARGAAATGATFCLSTFATTSPRDLQAAVPGLHWWFQLYWFTDRDLNWALVDKAVEAGAEAILLTVDLATLGSRERDRHTGFSLRGSMVMPVIAATGRHPTSNLMPVWNMLDPGVKWSDLEELVKRSPLPVIVKGLVRADDAVKSIDHGARGVVVSNHGGRQLDTAVSTARALPAVADAVGRRAAVLVDGGIRRGSDVAKALALGADAVLIGRPALWGLVQSGEEGVQHVLTLLQSEFDNAMALLGVTHTGDLSRDLIAG